MVTAGLLSVVNPSIQVADKKNGYIFL